MSNSTQPSPVARPPIWTPGSPSRALWISALAALRAAVLPLILVGCGPKHVAPSGAGGDVDAHPTGSGTGGRSPIRFDDVTDRAGIRYVYPPLPKPLRNLEAFGVGCAALDYDDDGWTDILLVASPHPILYHNRGNGTFEDVSTAAGLVGVSGDWKGVAVGDFDGDGRLDLLLTGFRCLALLRNLDGHRFQEVTAQAGLDPKNHGHWGSSAGFMDLDGSGRLSLVLLNYAVFGPGEPQYCELAPGVKSGCPPASYKPEFPEIWRNVGGRFKDVTRGSGFDQTPAGENVHGKSLVVAFTDFNDDGLVDFYVGNDGTPAEMMQNLGGFHFRNVAISQGTALGVRQQAQASMGADWADYDRDGKLDLVTTAFSGESYSLYRDCGAYFDNVSMRTGLAPATVNNLGFGAKFIDVDNDGWPDIVFANGHVYDNVDKVDSRYTYRQPTLLFHNRGGQGFDEIGASAGPGFAKPIVGRGSATADFDNDGRMDILVVDGEGKPLLLYNRSRTANHWLQIRLAGSPPDRFAYGARVTARAGKSVWIQDVSPASSYLSSSSPVVHFGLGSTDKLDSVEVRWSNRKAETFAIAAVDRRISIEQGRGTPVRGRRGLAR